MLLAWHRLERSAGGAPNSSSTPAGGGSTGTPKARLSEACGSRSISNTRWPSAARPRPRARVVVVLPTPPFWLATAQMRIGLLLHCRGNGGADTAASRHRRQLHRCDGGRGGVSRSCGGLFGGAVVGGAGGRIEALAKWIHRMRGVGQDDDHHPAVAVAPLCAVVLFARTELAIADHRQPRRLHALVGEQVHD